MPDKWDKVDPMNFDASVQFFIDSYRAGHEEWWTSCSCSASASLTAHTPILDAKDYIPNTTMQEGKLAILRYGDTYHVVSYKVMPMGLLARLEGNYKPCLLKDRNISWKELNDHLVGFYTDTLDMPQNVETVAKTLN